MRVNDSLNDRNRKKYKVNIPIDIFKNSLRNFRKIFNPHRMKLIDVNTIDINDPIFSVLKQDYPEFKVWWNKISKEGRKAFVYQQKDGLLGGILILKHENEYINGRYLNMSLLSALDKEDSVKISTLVVYHEHIGIGGYFIKKAIKFAKESGAKRIYLTHFPKQDDKLIGLIERFGFKDIASREKMTSSGVSEEYIYVYELNQKNYEYDSSNN